MNVSHVIVGTGLEVTLAKKQNIYIGSRAGNRRIERAIPMFMSNFGMAKDQATAVAIRLESLGRLQVDGEPINKPKEDRGLPIPVTPLSVATALANLKRDRTPKKTEVREAQMDVVVESPYEARKVQSKKVSSNKLRQRQRRR